MASLSKVYPCTSTGTNLPAQQNRGNSEADNRDRVAGTEKPMSIIQLTHTFWQCSGRFLAALALWRSHGQQEKLSHIHIPATESKGISGLFLSTKAPASPQSDSVYTQR